MYVCSILQITLHEDALQTESILLFFWPQTIHSLQTCTKIIASCVNNNTDVNLIVLQFHSGFHQFILHNIHHSGWGALNTACVAGTCNAVLL